MYAHGMPSESARVASEPPPVPRPVRRGRAQARRSVTIAQIAEESGLSTATVSKVLNGKPDVSARTRTLVQDAIRWTGGRLDAQNK